MATQDTNEEQKKESGDKDKGTVEQVDPNHKYTPEEVLEFWFGKLTTPNDSITPDKTLLWFKGGKEIDSVINKRFGKLVIDALDKRIYDDWTKEPRGITCYT